MTQEELEHLLHARAGPRGPLNVFQFTESSDTVEVPDPDNPAAGAKKKKQVPVYTWTDPGTGQVVKVQRDPDTGTYTKLFDGIDEKAKGEPATTPAQQAAAAGASDRKPVEGKPGIYLVTTKTQRPDGGTDTETHYEDEAGTRVPTPTATQAGRSEKPVQVNGKTYTQVTEVSDSNGVKKERTYLVDPATGQEVQAAAPPPELVNLPSNQKWATRYDAATGKYITEANPNYIKPSKIMADPNDPTKLINITEDDNGKPIVEAVSGQTVIKPADLPVLQAKYGEIAQGLGALAQDLNSRYARGEITEKQKNDAFTAAHAQADTQVKEINTILDTSKAIWSGELTQRGQSLQETQSRRSYASGLLGNALETGNSIARGAAGKGAGRDIVGGMAAILGVGQQLAQGMGGFRESPEIALPAALQQARGIGLPGFGQADGGVGAGTPAPPTPPGAPPAGGPNALGLGAIGAVPAPGGPPPRELTPAIGGPPQPLPERNGVPVTSTPAVPPGLSDPGFHMSPPGLQGMGEALQGGAGFGGSPVAAGGLGMYDPTADVQSMIGDGADPTWAEAVRRAAAEVNQPGYSWQRFSQPASRFG